MAYLDADMVNSWLEGSKLNVEAPLDATIEGFVAARVLGALAQRYDVATWTNDVSTPALVRQIMAMLYAAALYRRQYSEDLDTTPAWPVWLEQNATDTLTRISDGSIVLDDATIIEVITGLTSPVFYPTDISDTDDPRAFSMSMEF
jgi:hypothetical protein